MSVWAGRAGSVTDEGWETREEPVSSGKGGRTPEVRFSLNKGFSAHGWGPAQILRRRLLNPSPVKALESGFPKVIGWKPLFPLNTF